MKFELPITTKFAIRSLFRNSRRSLLSIAGISIGCSIALVNVGMARGKVNLFIKNITEGGIGHLQVVPKPWRQSRDPNLRLSHWENELSQIKNHPEVASVTARAKLQGMLAMGTHMVGVEILGVQPETEPHTNRYVRVLSSGRYLKSEDSHEMVIGKSIADRLRIDIGDSVVVTVVDQKGEIKSEMFNILGIISLGNKQIESMICQITLKDLEAMSGRLGAGEITVLLKTPSLLQSFLTQSSALISAEDTLMTWDEIRPDGKLAVEINEGMSKIMTLILIFIAFIGVASAQLTAIFERRKEFAVLSAIGMNNRKMMSLILSEALILGSLSWLATLILSGPLLSHYARVGFRVLSQSQSMNFSGMLIDPVFHPDFGSWFIFDSAALCYFSTLCASIYPALFTTRLNPADALRVAQ